MSSKNAPKIPAGRSLLQSILKSSFSIGSTVPGAVVATYGLIQAGEKTGFDKAYPEDYEKLVNLNNGLLWLLVEHWIGIIIFSSVRDFLGIHGHRTQVRLEEKIR